MTMKTEEEVREYVKKQHELFVIRHQKLFKELGLEWIKELTHYCDLTNEELNIVESSLRNWKNNLDHLMTDEEYDFWFNINSNILFVGDSDMLRAMA